MAATSDGNGIFEPGETVIVRPAWKNTGGSPFSLTGSASTFTGPPEGAMAHRFDGRLRLDRRRRDGRLRDGRQLLRPDRVCDPLPPATHWDATFTETLSDGDPAKVWTLHIGDSFTDVPTLTALLPKIETLLHNGVTTGCTATTYCPGDTVFRVQMAIFIAKGIAGGDANVPASGTGRSASPTTARPEAPLSSPTSPRPTSSASTSTTSPRRT